MSAFSCFFTKEDMVSRAYDIDEDLYEELKEISESKYDASVSKLVNAAIKYLIDNEEVQLYTINKKNGKIHRSFLIKVSLYEGLDKLRGKYNISMYKLVNIAIHNAIESEKIKRR